MFLILLTTKPFIGRYHQPMKITESWTSRIWLASWTFRYLILILSNYKCVDFNIKLLYEIFTVSHKLCVYGAYHITAAIKLCLSTIIVCKNCIFIGKHNKCLSGFNWTKAPKRVGIHPVAFIFGQSRAEIHNLGPSSSS